MAGFEVTTYGRFCGDHRGLEWEGFSAGMLKSALNMGELISFPSSKPVSVTPAASTFASSGSKYLRN
jgi:hypothetical protein